MATTSSAATITSSSTTTTTTTTIGQKKRSKAKNASVTAKKAPEKAPTIVRNNTTSPKPSTSKAKCKFLN